MKILFIESSKKSHYMPAKKMGHEVILVKEKISEKERENFDIVIEADLFDEVALLEKIRPLNIDACITRLEPYIPLAGYICDKLGLIGPSLEAALNARDKLRMRRKLAEFNVPQPKFFEIKSLDDLYKAASSLGYPFILKPISGAKSRYIKKITCYAEIEPFFNIVKDGCNNNQGDLFRNYKTIQVNDFGEVFLAEECITGKQVTTTTVVSKGDVKHISIADLITGQDIGVDAFYLISRTTPSRLSTSEQMEVYSVSTSAIKALGLDNTAVHPEFIITSDGPKVLEVAARVGGYRKEMTEYAFGILLNKVVIQIALGLEVDLKPLFTKAACSMEVWPTESGVLSSDIEFNYSVEEYNAKFGKDSVYSVPPMGEFPICNFTLSASTPIEAETKAWEINKDILSKVKFLK